MGAMWYWLLLIKINSHNYCKYLMLLNIFVDTLDTVVAVRKVDRGK